MIPLSISVLILLNVGAVINDNVGWKEYMKENIDEFHDIPLEWESGSKVPSWLSGTYVRNGPARLTFESPRRHLNSWLDGFAKLHSFKFIGDKVLFSGKMLESPNYKASVEAGELVPQTTLNKFANPDDEWTFWEKMQISYKALAGTAFDNNNPALWRMGEKSIENGIYMAVTDAPVPLRFNISDLSTLESLGPNSYPFTLSGCAHYMRERDTDNSLSFQRKKLFTGKPFVEVQRYPPHKTYQDPDVISTFMPRKYSNVHSFSITEEFAIFFFYPVIINPKKYFSSNFHVFELLEWVDNEDTEIFIVDLKTGKSTNMTTHPFYSAHHVNAYRTTEDELVVDICPTPYENMREYLVLDNLLNPPVESTWVSTNKDSEFMRFTINMAEGKVQHKFFPNPTKSRWTNQFDFPVINEKYRGVKYCVVYGVTAFDYSRTALVKKNLCDSNLDKVWYIENHYASEMWFLETPGATTEDDGVLLTLMFDGEKSASYLLLLDAKTLKTIARSYLPHSIPWSAHGMYFPEADFTKQYKQQEQTESKEDDKSKTMKGEL